MKLLIVFGLFMASVAQAEERYLRMVDCQFANGVTIRGERTLKQNQYSDFAVTAFFGWNSQALRASALPFEIRPNQVTFTYNAPWAPGNYTQGEYRFEGAFDPDSDAVQTVPGELEGWAGRIEGTCALQFMNGR